MFTALILGESHSGKTRSLGTLPGRTILFNFDGPDNVTSLRVPWLERTRLKDWWAEGKEIPKVLVINYSATQRDLSLSATPDPKKDKIQWFIEDLNSIGKEHLGEFENVALETLGPFGDEVLDFVVASNGRKDTQIQDYKVAQYKIQAIFASIMGLGKNFVVTGHLQSEKDEITGRGRVTPLIWGTKLPSSIPRMFGEVFQSLTISDGKGGVAYKWLTQPDPSGFLGFLGSRKLDKLPKFIDQDFGYLDKVMREQEEMFARLEAEAKKQKEKEGGK